MATVVDRNKKWYAVINVQDEQGNRKQKWICTNLPSKNGKANKTAAKKIANQLQEEYDKKKTPYTKITCTCKMKVDTHKSVGVYFFRSIMNMERK